MKFFNFLSKKKKTELEIEEEITNNIIEEETQEQVETVTAIVIKYIENDEGEIPEIFKICNFHSEMLPDINSIIWAPDLNKNKLMPYKVIRIDFIEDLDVNIAKFNYIVVKDAMISDII